MTMKTDKQEKIKVIELISSMRMGGAESLVREYALKLDKTQFRVMVVSIEGRSGSPNEAMLDENEVNSIYIDDMIRTYRFLPRKINSLLKYIRRRQILVSEIRNIRPDVIHIHMAIKIAACIPYRFLKNSALFYTVHSTPNAMITRLKQGNTICRMIRKFALQLVALHDSMAEELNAMFGVSNVVVQPNGVDFEKFRNPTKSSVEFRKEVGIPENAFVVGHVGRFSAVKNHAFLVSVFVEVSKRKSDSHLLLTGSGPLEDEVRKQMCDLGLEGSLTILSNRADIPDILNATDVFVFPSKYEGFPMTLIEAQVAGLRCVVSDTVSKQTHLTENLVVLSLDDPPGKWADIILDRSLNGIPLGNLDDYDINKNIKRLEQLYLDAVEGGK